jgi:NADH dehydrogenase
VRGARIKVLTRNSDRAKFLKPMGQVGQISIHGGDAVDPNAVAAVLEGADAVVNTVGILAENSRQYFSTLQIELPGRIASQARVKGVKRVVHISAIGADSRSGIKYASTKGQGEKKLLSRFPKATVLRPSLVFGAGDGFFNRFAKMALFAPGLPVIAGGMNRVQPVYVGDVAEAVVVALADDTTAGKIYELGGPDVMTFREVMAYIIQHIDRRRMLIPMPYWVMVLIATMMSPLPNAPVTRDQLKQLKHDNVVGAGALGLADLGIAAKPVDLIVPEFLTRYKPGGRFSTR